MFGSGNWLGALDCFDSTKIYYTIYLLSKFPFNLVCQTGFYKINSATTVSVKHNKWRTSHYYKKLSIFFVNNKAT